MGKKQKMKKANPVHTTLDEYAATLQKEIDAEKGGAGESEEAPGGSQPKPNLDYRKSLQKLKKLAKSLPSNVFAQQLVSKVQEAEQAEQASSTDGSETTDTDDEAPELVNGESSSKFPDLSPLGHALPCSDEYPKHSRGEKKARRLLMKLDLKPIDNVSRVTMKKSKNIMLYIDKPEVFKCAPDTYIIFGKVCVEDLTNAAATQAAERYREVEAARVGGAAAANAGGTAQINDDDDGEDVDEAAAKDLDDKDIELVQMQASCSRGKAIKALLQNGHDVVNAIMDLTMG